MTRVEQLRNEYPVFEYVGNTYHFDSEGLTLEFAYQFNQELSCKHTVLFAEISEAQVQKIPQSELQALVDHIGLIEGFSYWKAACTQEFKVSAFNLLPEQLEWWHTVLINGMGEYFYVNQIDFTPPDFVKFVSGDAAIHAKPQISNLISPPSITTSTRMLIPVGGGKDSVVSLELLTQSQPSENLGCLVINPTQAALDTIQVSGINNVHRIERRFDPALRQFTESRGLNGHVPISASFAWISLLAARVLNYDLVAISNESSSNEGSVEFQGRIINHQYSKTYEFEHALQEYTNTWLAPTTPWYFSLLRPILELQIAAIFAQHTKYHADFRSCNRGQKTNSWCGNCPKCLFAYLILSPFLSQIRLTELFGSNVLNNEQLWHELQQLLGIVPQKPLECVGTRAESLTAAHMATLKITAEKQPLPKLLQLLKSELVMQQADLDEQTVTLLTSWNQANSVPKELAALLKQRVQSSHTQ